MLCRTCRCGKKSGVLPKLYHCPRIKYVRKKEILPLREMIARGGEICGDLFEEELLRCSNSYERLFITTSLLFASFFGVENWAERYCWVHSQIKVTHNILANRIEI